jgi:hypothetical protein
MVVPQPDRASLWTPPPAACHAQPFTRRFGPRCHAGQVVFVTVAGKSNYPVKEPMGVQLTADVVRDIAKLLETRGFPPFTDEDIGRLHLVLYDLLYEGHEDTVRLQ